MKPIIGILGPTAVGKSSLAIQLAQDLKTEIISADSMQIYKKFDIGTAKASKDELALVKHHLIDVVEPDANFSSYLFKKETQTVLEEFEKRDIIPLIAGGTGFFFKNLLYQFDFEEGDNLEEIRQEIIFGAVSKDKLIEISRLVKQKDVETNVFHLNIFILPTSLTQPQL